MSDDKPLTEQEELFLEYMFGGQSMTKAAELAGYHSNYGYYLCKRLKKHIIDTAEYIIALHAVPAAHKLAETLTDDGSTPNSNLRLEAAKQILDRAGLSKKERIEISSEGPAPIFWLPRKDGDTEA